MIFGDIKRTNTFLIKQIKERIEEERILVLDNLGILSKVFKDISYKVKDFSFDFKNVTKIDLLDAISSQINLTIHEQKHLYDALMKKKGLNLNIKIEEIISLLLTTSNPYIHSLNDISVIEELIYKLSRIIELDTVLLENGNKQSFFKKLENENLILDLSEINSSAVKNILNLLFLQEISSSQVFTDLNIIINSPEGFSFLNVNKLFVDFIKRLLEKLYLNENKIYLTLRFADIDPSFYYFFDQIIVFNSNTASLFNEAIKLGKEVMLHQGKIIEIKKIDLPYHVYDTLNKTSETKQFIAKRKSYLELEYGDLSDIISNFLLEIEKSMINRKEAKNYLFALGYFSNKVDSLLDKLIRDNLLEEKIIGGVKKLMVTTKGLFFAKQHKMLKND
ncbi:MAG: hypothetical protein RQ922_02535 [Thermoproteota archaeon]|nr:hypothetical protein [Thermoproteota archaeon]